MTSAKTLNIFLLCLFSSIFSQAQFSLSTIQSTASSFQFIFSNKSQEFITTLPQEFSSYDSISVIDHDTTTIDQQLAVRMELHLINTVSQQQIRQQIALPLTLNTTSIATEASKEKLVTTEVTPPTHKKYIQIGAFSNEEGAQDLSKTAFIFKTKIVYTGQLWKVLIPHEQVPYDEVKKFHQDAFVTYY